MPYPEPLHAKRPLPDVAGVALLADARTQRPLAGADRRQPRPTAAADARPATRSLCAAPSRPRGLAAAAAGWRAAQRAASAWITWRRCNSAAGRVNACWHWTTPGSRPHPAPGQHVPARRRAGMDDDSIPCRRAATATRQSAACAKAAWARPAASNTRRRPWPCTVRCSRPAATDAAPGLSGQRARSSSCMSPAWTICRRAEGRSRTPVRRRATTSFTTSAQPPGALPARRPRRRSMPRRANPTAQENQDETRPGHRRQRRHRRGDLPPPSPPTAVTSSSTPTGAATRPRPWSPKSSPAAAGRGCRLRRHRAPPPAPALESRCSTPARSRCWSTTPASTTTPSSPA